MIFTNAAAIARLWREKRVVVDVRSAARLHRDGVYPVLTAVGRKTECYARVDRIARVGEGCVLLTLTLVGRPIRRRRKHRPHAPRRLFGGRAA